MNYYGQGVKTNYLAIDEKRQEHFLNWMKKLNNDWINEKNIEIEQEIEEKLVIYINEIKNDTIFDNSYIPWFRSIQFQEHGTNFTLDINPNSVKEPLFKVFRHIKKSY